MVGLAHIHGYASSDPEVAYDMELLRGTMEDIYRAVPYNYMLHFASDAPSDEDAEKCAAHVKRAADGLDKYLSNRDHKFLHGDKVLWDDF